MDRFRVIVTDHVFDDLAIERDILGDIAEVVDLGAEVDRSNPAEVKSVLAEADGVLNLRWPLDTDLVRALADCRIIVRYGIGVDNVDLDTATDLGIPVANVPEYCIEEVATHAVTLALALLRGVKRYDTSVADGNWDRAAGPRIHRLSELTVGIVGYGSIGRAVGDRLAAFGVDIVAYDPYITASDIAAHDVDLVEFDSLLDRSDLVTIHSPLTDATRGLFDATVFETLADEAYLVNVARGAIVDTEALYRALTEGAIAGAGLDVFPEEPPSAAEPLRDHPDVITTPHIAWYSEESNVERRRTAAETVRAALTDAQPENIINDAVR